MRMTEEEYRRLTGQASEKKKNKYRARKVNVDGICFDSQKEADYYCQLKLLLRAGEIAGFCRQPRFVITEGTDGGAGTEYVSDFVIFYPDGKYRIVDVKGVKTEVFKLKLKSFREKYPRLKIYLE